MPFPLGWNPFLVCIRHIRCDIFVYTYFAHAFVRKVNLSGIECHIPRRTFTSVPVSIYIITAPSRFWVRHILHKLRKCRVATFLECFLYHFTFFSLKLITGWISALFRYLIGLSEKYFHRNIVYCGTRSRNADILVFNDNVRSVIVFCVVDVEFLDITKNFYLVAVL